MVTFQVISSHGGTWYDSSTGVPTEPENDFGQGSKTSCKSMRVGAKAKSDMKKKTLPSAAGMNILRGITPIVDPAEPVSPINPIPRSIRTPIR